MLGFYLVTTTISGGIFYLSSKAYGGYLKRNHYISTTGEKRKEELVFSALYYAFKALLLGYNIYYAIKILWEGPKQFEERAKAELKDGKIREMTQEEIAESIEEEECETFAVDTSSIKHYDEMTREEKLAFLEHEREFLLNSKDEKKEEPVQFKMNQK